MDVLNVVRYVYHQYMVRRFNKSNHETNASECVSPHWTLFVQKVRKNEMYDAYTKCMRFVVDAAAALVSSAYSLSHK